MYQEFGCLICCRTATFCQVLIDRYNARAAFELERIWGFLMDAQFIASDCAAAVL
jgi:hypothetical protein